MPLTATKSVVDYAASSSARTDSASSSLKRNKPHTNLVLFDLGAMLAGIALGQDVRKAMLETEMVALPSAVK